MTISFGKVGKRQSGIFFIGFSLDFWIFFIGFHWIFIGFLSYGQILHRWELNVLSDHFSMKFLKWGPEKSDLGRDLESERPLMLHQLKRTLGPLGHMQHKSYVMEKHTETHIETQQDPLFTSSGTHAAQILHTQTHIETQKKLKRTLCFQPLGHMQHPSLFAQIILCVEAHTHWKTKCFDLFMTLDSPPYLPKQEVQDNAKSWQVLSLHRDWWGIISHCFYNITSFKDGLKRRIVVPPVTFFVKLCLETVLRISRHWQVFMCTPKDWH